jgi:hypothetical protein
MKYDILEYIMKGVVYHKKKLRESFMQEILNASVSAQFGNSIELYINRNNLTIYKSSKDYQNPLSEDRYERIIIFSPVDVNRTLIEFEEPNTVKPDTKALHNKNLLNRLFVLTNQGI